MYVAIQLTGLLLKSFLIIVVNRDHGVVANVTNSDIVVSEFKHQSRFLRSLLGKHLWARYEPLYIVKNGLNSTTTVLLQGGIRH